MTMIDVDLLVRDAAGVVHRANPLGVAHGRCLGCALPFPCPSVAAGEQLVLGVDLAACRCGGVHEPREHAVRCHCGRSTFDFHALCEAHEHEVLTL